VLVALHLSFKDMLMKLYWVKTRWFIKRLFRGFVWNMPNNRKMVYLTFDDGPTPEITEWVLGILKQHEIKATFFCIGNNIDSHPDIFQRVISDGHAIGNHTYNHLNGWRSDDIKYLENVAAAEKSILQHCPSFGVSKLFRPPYGRMKRTQAARVRQQGYKIIMWDVLSADFDLTITPEKCLKNVTDNAREGSIIIFHDSVKAFPNLEYALPRAIEYLKGKNYTFGVIS
jgi:peptidoglycan/xylan/chitin deacetylase (PgdA/CDA1 family)